MLETGATVGRDRNLDWQDDLQASLRRAQDAIQQGVQQQDQMVQRWTDKMREAYPDWGRERWQRQMEKKWRKKAEAEARIASASLFEGYLWTLGALILFIVAMSAMPVSLFLIFPALHLGHRGSRVISRHRGKMGVVDPNAPRGQVPLPAQNRIPDSQRDARARRFGTLESFGRDLRQGAQIGNVIDGANTRGAYNGAVGPVAHAPLATDPRDARVDIICDKILAELRDSPEVVREIFLKPEQTVAALRDTCKNLTRRERDVRRFLSPEEDARLLREREGLQKRVEIETDEVTKMRLVSALAALEQQREQRTELSRSASRFEAEQTRISYTLESLYTQVVRMRSADSGSADVAGAGLRRSLDALSQEVNALADALETVNAAKQAPKTDAQKMAGLAVQPGGTPTIGTQNIGAQNISNVPPLGDKA